MKKKLCIVLAALMTVGMYAYQAQAAEDESWWMKILKEFFYWIEKTFLDFGATLVEWILKVVPENAVSFDLSPISNFIAAANYWIPLNYGLTLVLAYYAFLLVFVIVKFILKLIPTIG